MKTKLKCAAVLATVLSAALLQGSSLVAKEMRDEPTEVAVELEEERIERAFDRLQSYWRNRFGADNENYEDARLIAFREGVATPCGFLTGSSYCPFDRSVYFNLGRFDAEHRPIATREKAHAFVLAHELGHHVQSLRGTVAQLDTEQRENQADRWAEVALRDVRP